MLPNPHVLRSNYKPQKEQDMYGQAARILRFSDTVHADVHMYAHIAEIPPIFQWHELGV